MFVHLRLHTEFSVVDGTTRIDALAHAVRQDRQPAVAMTDFNNLFGAIKFYKETRSKGIKPLLGAEIALAAPDAPAAAAAAPTRIVLLVQNTQGYLHLCELLARMWTRNVVKTQAVCTWPWLEELNEGLIALSGAQAGALGQALLRGDAAGATQEAQRLAALFAGRFYIELQRAGRPEDEIYIRAALPLAAQLQLPVVATHPVQFLGPDEYEAHEARVCIAQGEMLANPQRLRRFTHEQYFKTAAQMQALFADIPSAVTNTVEIARRCNLTLVLGKPRLPDFPTPNGMPIEQYFRIASYDGLKDRLLKLYADPVVREKHRLRYESRLEFELETIIKMGFPGYFLIVGDFIQWAKNNNCPVGPGRGSGAGSLVAYALKITDLDPLEYNLLFERFLNPERVSMPDFDIDFCQSNRDRVIDYVKLKYGKEAVSQIATFGTMAAKAAIRDVGRVMDLSYSFCDGISKMVPAKPGMSYTLAYPPEPKKEGDKNNYALELEPQLYERVRKEEDVRTVIEMAQKLEGVTRNIGMHAGGVLIAPGKLTDFCPLFQQPGSESAVSQYDKDDVEAIGLVKFDFLGLATLTILEIARQFIQKRHSGQENFSFENVPLDDGPTYRLFSEGRTESVFQFESRGMQAMLKDAKPSRLEDLIALNALYRPGPMDLIPSFVHRKHGREEVIYPHPLVEPVLSETYGIMVYQEQVMQTAQVLGGYSLGGADMLRRAMGKKKPEEMAQHREIFRKGAAEKGISQEKADEVFDLMEKFAGYGFNKSHAAAYSLLAYHTGWLKVHYKAEFFCANMTVEMDDTDKLKVLYEDALREGLTFEPPHINRGNYEFEPITDKVIRYGLGAIKGTGKQAIEAIVAARNGQGSGPQGQEKGPFKSLFDFCLRVDRSLFNKRTLEALIKSGAFDSIDVNRAALIASIDIAFEFASAQIANANQGGLFDMGDENAYGSSTKEPDLITTMAWGVKERLTQEKTAIGFYLSGHLFDEVEAEVRRFVRTPINALQDNREPQFVAGIISDLRVINSQRGRLILLKLDDKTRTIDASIDEGLFNHHRDGMKDDELIIVYGRLQPDHFSGGLRIKIQQVLNLEQARCKFGRYIKVDLQDKNNEKNNNEKINVEEIISLLNKFPPKKQTTDQGEVFLGLPLRLQVCCHSAQGAARAELQLGDDWRLYPSQAALAALATLAALAASPPPTLGHTLTDYGPLEIVYDGTA